MEPNSVTIEMTIVGVATAYIITMLMGKHHEMQNKRRGWFIPKLQRVFKVMPKYVGQEVNTLSLTSITVCLQIILC